MKLAKSFEGLDDSNMKSIKTIALEDDDEGH